MTQFAIMPALNSDALRPGDFIQMRYAAKRATVEKLTATLAQLNAEDDDEIYWRTHEQLNPGHNREICRGLEIHTTSRWERTLLGGQMGGSRAGN